MEIQAIQFLPEQNGVVPRPLTVELKFKEQEDLARYLEVNPLCVYLVRSDDLEQFDVFSGVVTDHGLRDPNQPLTRYFKRGTPGEISKLEGEYTSSVRVKQSIYAGLRGALDDKIHHVLILGVSKEWFNECWLEVVDATTTEDGNASARAQFGAGGVAEEKERAAAAFLRLISREVVPPKLKNRYIGNSSQIELVRVMILKAARADCTVLIEGESGTGKEIVARAIHENSNPGRKGHPFYAVNCSAIPSDLLESELFGWEPGGHAQADRAKPGAWKLAEGGILFLDEIGDLQRHHQGKLLRAIQFGEIIPLGGRAQIVRTRVIAATNRDLSSMVMHGDFRDDLYQRLCELNIRTPALRDHPEDIPWLAQRYWSDISGGGTLSASVMSELENRWPGNVRGLESLLKQIHIMFGSEAPTVEGVRGVKERMTHGPNVAGSGDPYKTHCFDCIHHLRDADKVVRSTKVAMRGLQVDGKIEQGTLDAVRKMVAKHLLDLDSSCATPVLFGANHTYKIVYQLKNKVAALREYLDADGPGARDCYENELKPLFEAVESAIIDQINTLLQNYRTAPRHSSNDGGGRSDFH